MNTPDLKQLKALIALCRKNGVTSIKHGDIELTLGEIPNKVPKKGTQKKDQVSELSEKIESDSLSPEALLFWSSGEDVQETLDKVASRES